MNILIDTILFSFSGFVTPGPSSTALSCSIARQLCSEDPACAQILEIIPKVCGLELGESNKSFFKIFFWRAPFGYVYFLYFQMNQNWVQKSILAWL
jgi:hypothetical protein